MDTRPAGRLAPGRQPGDFLTDKGDAMNKPDYTETLNKLQAMFAGDFDWEEYHGEHGSEEPEDIFRTLFLWHDYRTGDRKVGTADCGGHHFDDTPKVFYRAMHLFQPSQIDLSDMYKTGSMIDFVSPCEQFMGSLQLFKHECQLYFSCVNEYRHTESRGIRGGWADCDNGETCTSDLGNKWFQTVVAALEREWMIYGGNDFTV